MLIQHKSFEVPHESKTRRRKRSETFDESGHSPYFKYLLIPGIIGFMLFCILINVNFKRDLNGKVANNRHESVTEKAVEQGTNQKVIRDGSTLSDEAVREQELKQQLLVKGLSLDFFSKDTLMLKQTVKNKFNSELSRSEDLTGIGLNSIKIRKVKSEAYNNEESDMVLPTEIVKLERSSREPFKLRKIILKNVRQIGREPIQMESHLQTSKDIHNEVGNSLNLDTHPKQVTDLHMATFLVDGNRPKITRKISQETQRSLQRPETIRRKGELLPDFYKKDASPVADSYDLSKGNAKTLTTGNPQKVSKTGFLDEVKNDSSMKKFETPNKNGPGNTLKMATYNNRKQETNIEFPERAVELVGELPQEKINLSLQYHNESTSEEQTPKGTTDIVGNVVQLPPQTIWDDITAGNTPKLAANRWQKNNNQQTYIKFEARAQLIGETPREKDNPDLQNNNESISEEEQIDHNRQTTEGTTHPPGNTAQLPDHNIGHVETFGNFMKLATNGWHKNNEVKARTALLVGEFSTNTNKSSEEEENDYHLQTKEEITHSIGNNVQRPSYTLASDIKTDTTLKLSTNSRLKNLVEHSDIAFIARKAQLVAEVPEEKDTLGVEYYNESVSEEKQTSHLPQTSEASLNSVDNGLWDALIGNTPTLAAKTRPKNVVEHSEIKFLARDGDESALQGNNESVSEEKQTGQPTYLLFNKHAAGEDMTPNYYIPLTLKPTTKFNHITWRFKAQDTVESVGVLNSGEPRNKIKKKMKYNLKKNPFLAEIKHGKSQFDLRHDNSILHPKRDSTELNIKNQMEFPSKRNQLNAEVDPGMSGFLLKHGNSSSVLRTGSHLKDDNFIYDLKHGNTVFHLKYGNSDLKHENAPISNIKQDNTVNQLKHSNSVSFLKHGNTVFHLNRDNSISNHSTGSHSKHDNSNFDLSTGSHLKHDNSISHFKHDNSVSKTKHQNSVSHLKHDNTVSQLKHGNSVSKIKHKNSVSQLKHENSHLKHDHSVLDLNCDNIVHHFKHGNSVSNLNHGNTNSYLQHGNSVPGAHLVENKLKLFTTAPYTGTENLSEEDVQNFSFQHQFVLKVGNNATGNLHTNNSPINYRSYNAKNIQLSDQKSKKGPLGVEDQPVEDIYHLNKDTAVQAIEIPVPLNGDQRNLHTSAIFGETLDGNIGRYPLTKRLLPQRTDNDRLDNKDQAFKDFHHESKETIAQVTGLPLPGQNPLNVHTNDIFGETIVGKIGRHHLTKRLLPKRTDNDRLFSKEQAFEHVYHLNEETVSQVSEMTPADQEPLNVHTNAIFGDITVGDVTRQHVTKGLLPKGTKNKNMNSKPLPFEDVVLLFNDTVAQVTKIPLALQEPLQLDTNAILGDIVVGNATRHHLAKRQVDINSKVIDTITYIASAARCTEDKVNCALTCSGGSVSHIDEDLDYLQSVCGNRELTLTLDNCEFMDGTMKSSLFIGYYRLKALTVSNSNLKTIQTGAFKRATVQNIQVMEFVNNVITSLEPETFDGLIKLTNFRFLQDPLTDGYQFKGNQFLKPMAATLLNVTIMQRTNGDVPLNPKDWLQGTDLKTLYTVDLSNNNMRGILDAATFRSLVAVRRLYLQNCSLEFIDMTPFGVIDNLFYLYLNNNRLMTLDSLFLDHIHSRGIILSAKGNQWNCDCGNRKMVEYLQSIKRFTSLISGDYVCVEPAEWRHLNMLNITLNCETTIEVTTTTSMSTPKSTTSLVTEKEESTEDVTTTPKVTENDESTEDVTTSKSTTSSVTEEEESTEDISTQQLNTTAFSTTSSNPDEDKTTTTTVAPEEETSTTLQTFTTSEIPATTPTPMVFLHCNTGNSTESSAFPVKPSLTRLKIYTLSATSVIIASSSFNRDSYLIYFTNHTLYENATQTSKTEWKVDDLKSQESYLFCVVKGGDSTVSPFDCHSHSLAVAMESWLNIDDMPWFITACILVALHCCLIGLAAVYYRLRKRSAFESTPLYCETSRKSLRNSRIVSLRQQNHVTYLSPKPRRAAASKATSLLYATPPMEAAPTLPNVYHDQPCRDNIPRTSRCPDTNIDDDYFDVIARYEEPVSNMSHVYKEVSYHCPFIPKELANDISDNEVEYHVIDHYEEIKF